MPEPDLPPLVLDSKITNSNGTNAGTAIDIDTDGSVLNDYQNLELFLKETLLELPEQTTIRLMEGYGITENVALVITSDNLLLHYMKMLSRFVLII
jgi:Asp-tRNA(Asn)/Glu-tRNA(Gln) amidotransferase B subunit